MTRAMVLAVVSCSFALAGCSSDSDASRPQSPTTTTPTAPKVADPPATPPVKARPARGALVRSDPLPALIRGELKDRMTEHGDDMESLLWSALMLDYDGVGAISRWLGETPKLSRPSASARGTLNEALPPEFFDLQDELHRAAFDLRQAALENDDEAIAKHFSRITSSCIRCHSLYLRMPKSKPVK